MDTLRRFSKIALTVAGVCSFLAPLLTRLVIGQAFYLTGSGKLAHMDKIVAFFTDIGIPFPALNANFISRLEFYGGIALILGLATRFAALGLTSTMIVALMTAEKQSFLDALHMRGDAGLTDIVPFVYLLFLLWLVLFGPGALSLDALIARWLRAPEKQQTRE